MDEFTKSLDSIIKDMIQEAVSIGGVPAGGKSNFRDAITISEALDAIILWYNIGENTYILKRELSVSL